MSDSAVETARAYYDSPDADTFYRTVWGGEDIHVGLYDGPGEDIAVASRRTVDRMAELVEPGAGERILDLGSGYGGAARHLARSTGCAVTCLNLSEVENERNRMLTEEQGLGAAVEVVRGAFEDLPFDDDSYDVVWSQDAFLHSGDRDRVIAEAARVLRPGGRFVFTDPMATDDADPAGLAPILDRIKLATMATPSFYRAALERAGLTEVEFDEHADQLAAHYGRVLEELERRGPELADQLSADYVTAMRTGLRHWVDGGRAGRLTWGIFRARG